MHLIPKKDGGVRGVCDYRMLNKCTRKMAQPLPNVQDILYSISDAKYFSSLDALMGYMQLPLCPTDGYVERSSVSTPFGVYSFLRVPFGLTNAPGFYSAVVHEILEGQIGKHAYCYMDDTVIYSKTFNQHLEHLDLVLSAFEKANMKLNKAKCSILAPRIKFLGYVVDQTGLSCDPRLIEAIQKRTPPRNARQTLSFLGLCNYYRRFVKDYAKIAEPLTRVCGKTRHWTWGPEQQEAFETLKQKLVTAPVLRTANYNLPFRLICDASQQACAAVLTQQEAEPPHKDYVVGYWSCKNSKAESNLSITELEMLAVVKAVEHWSPILYGTPCTVETDHAALQYLLTNKKLKGKLARWALRLAPYDLKIEWRRGRTNRADFLTRGYSSDDTSDAEDTASVTPHEGLQGQSEDEPPQPADDTQGGLTTSHMQEPTQAIHHIYAHGPGMDPADKWSTMA